MSSRPHPKSGRPMHGSLQSFDLGAEVARLREEEAFREGVGTRSRCARVRGRAWCCSPTGNGRRCVTYCPRNQAEQAGLPTTIAGCSAASFGWRGLGRHGGRYPTNTASGREPNGATSCGSSRAYGSISSGCWGRKIYQDRRRRSLTDAVEGERRSSATERQRPDIKWRFGASGAAVASSPVLPDR